MAASLRAATGVPLGVDLAVPKTCTLSCRFCQLGPTAHTTVSRTASPPIAEVLAELRSWLASGQTAGFITASGSGEPTLHTHFGDLLSAGARAETACRSLLLTNGTLFSLPEVRVMPRLRMSSKSRYTRGIRPPSKVSGPTASLAPLRGRLGGLSCVQAPIFRPARPRVFIIPGVNDQPEQVQRIAALAQTFQPDTIALNTAVRPPADGTVTACPPERLRELTALFGFGRARKRRRTRDLADGAHR